MSPSDLDLRHLQDSLATAERVSTSNVRLCEVDGIVDFFELGAQW